MDETSAYVDLDTRDDRLLLVHEEPFFAYFLHPIVFDLLLCFGQRDIL